MAILDLDNPKVVITPTYMAMLKEAVWPYLGFLIVVTILIIVIPDSKLPTDPTLRTKTILEGVSLFWSFLIPFIFIQPYFARLFLKFEINRAGIKIICGPFFGFPVLIPWQFVKIEPALWGGLYLYKIGSFFIRLPLCISGQESLFQKAILQYAPEHHSVRKQFNL